MSKKNIELWMDKDKKYGFFDTKTQSFTDKPVKKKKPKKSKKSKKPKKSKKSKKPKKKCEIKEKKFKVESNPAGRCFITVLNKRVYLKSKPKPKPKNKQTKSKQRRKLLKMVR
jgi:hypothetical protein